MEQEISTSLPTIHDCKKHWTYTDENGSEKEFTEAEVQEHLPKWIAEDFYADSVYKVDEEMAYTYYFYEYDEEKLKKFDHDFLKRNYTDRDYEMFGLVKMFNDGVLKSPAFVQWNSKDWGFRELLYHFNTRKFIQSLWSSQTQIDILTYFKQIYKTIVNERLQKQALENYNILLAEAKESLKVEKAEAAAKRKAQQKSTTPKPTPEYSLSLDEIIAYANGEGKAHAEAIRSMLRYFKDEKEGWDNAKVKKQIHDILLPDSHTVNIAQQTNTGCQQFAHVSDSTFQK